MGEILNTLHKGLVCWKAFSCDIITIFSLKSQMATEWWTKLGSNIEEVEVPYCFSWFSFEFQGHTGQNKQIFTTNRAFPDCNCRLKPHMAVTDFDKQCAISDCHFGLSSQMAMKWCTKLGSSIEDVSYCFWRTFISYSWWQGQKNADLNKHASHENMLAMMYWFQDASSTKCLPWQLIHLS